jgi:hypothetical protein
MYTQKNYLIIIWLECNFLWILEQTELFESIQINSKIKEKIKRGTGPASVHGPFTWAA